ncbi:MAG: EAL domain-containing protein [Pseudomonadota bacterium]
MSHEILNAKILVVDDQEVNVTLLKCILADAGYQSVSATTDSRKVFDLYQANRYDAVLLDLHMPHLDGFAVMEALQTIESEYSLPILVITAQPDHKLRALAAGAKDFISKPFDNAEVVSRLRNMLALRLLNNQLLASQDALIARSAELASANYFMSSLIENIPSMIFVKSAHDLGLVRMNRAGEELLGYSRDALIGKTGFEIFPQEEANLFSTTDNQVLNTRSVLDIAEQAIHTHDKGTRILHTRKIPLFDQHGELRHILAVSEDITERIEMEKEIQRLNAGLAERAQRLEASNEEQQAALNYIAMFDVLTGLPNRTFFLQTLHRVLQSHARTNSRLALVVLDIRHFGRINDSFGKAAGDEVLALIARRISENSQFGCARIGGNTFAIALSDLQSDGDVAQALKRYVLDTLSQAFVFQGREITFGTRCGIALFPGDGLGIEELFGNAEAALKSAKTQGEEYLFYTPGLNARVADQITLEAELRKAIAEQQFILHYQPKVNSETGRLTGFEALIRWNHPKRGLVPPNEFIPILEETGMILEVGKWVLKQAADDFRMWCRDGLEPPPIAVNISAIQIRRPDFVETVWKMCGHGKEPQATIDLEITESVLMEDINRIIPSLWKLRNTGYGVAIDDFGTGYSSFSYLAQIPLTAIKIDRSFIQNLTTGPRHHTIVSTMIKLAHSLNLTVVAEGVETEQQCSKLREMKCDESQGYLFGRPMSVEDAGMLMSRLSSSTSSTRPDSAMRD